MVETTALGAAGLAGLATGLWSDAEHFLAAQEEATIFTSSMSDNERATLLAGWAQAVQAVKGLAVHD
jgi:glycerol kinase